MTAPGALPPGVVYRGFRTATACLVTKQVRDADGGSCTQVLNARHDVRSHSPDGFGWGDNSDGAAQLALALTLDVLNGDVERARLVYLEVKWLVVRMLPLERWAIPAVLVADTIERAERDRARAIDKLLHEQHGGR